MDKLSISLTIWSKRDIIETMISYIARDITPKLKQMAKKFPAVAVIGPRQSGKTTLVKNIFPDYRYVSLEDLDNRSFASDDPRGFLQLYNGKTIIDEAQKSPTLFSYLQTQIDTSKTMGEYILTGSQNFLLAEKISQSLAGRVGILKLLPLSVHELVKIKISYGDYQKYIFQGFYPAVYDRRIDPQDWYASYLQTYLERDVRSILNIENLALFQKFLKLCAGRSGQIINFSSLANDCGLSHNTVKSWLSILESSFIIFTIQPFFNNFNKRLIKSPKLYFYDTGLVCYLLGMTQSAQVTAHFLKGALFENFIAAEKMKAFSNQGKNLVLYFWHDKRGREIDFLYEELPGKIHAVEAKAGETYSPEMAENLFYWQKLSQTKDTVQLVYGGKQSQKRNGIDVVSWKDFLNLSGT